MREYEKSIVIVKIINFMNLMNCGMEYEWFGFLRDVNSVSLIVYINW